MTETIFFIMDLIVGAISPFYLAATIAVAVGLGCGLYLRGKMRSRAGSAGAVWAAKSLMPKEEAKVILPRIAEAAEGMYVFPRLTASTVLQRGRRAGTAREAANVDLHDLVLDYAVYTSECDLVCVVLVDHGKKATPSDALRDELLRAAELPVIKVRPGHMPEPALLRGHLQLALDQRRGVTRTSKGSKAPVSGHLAPA